MKRRFATLDVFTNQQFTGNPLAVVLEAANLDVAAMQAIAREFNLSETVFVLPPENSANRARLRIFTPKRELPFAGHPTVGAAVLLACLDGGKAARAMVLEENIGSVSCQVAPAQDRGDATFTLPALPKEAGAPPADDVLAVALGLSFGDIGFNAFKPSCWSAGNPFIFVPLKSLNAIARAAPSGQFASAFGDRAAFLFSRETAERGNDFHARMFAPNMGVAEDPATGSAVAAFAGVLTRFNSLQDGNHTLMIEQGFEMGRPSVITLALTQAGGTLTTASIGGGAVIVAEGTIEA